MDVQPQAICPTCHRVPPCDHLGERFMSTLNEVMRDYGPTLAHLAAYDRGECGHDHEGCEHDMGSDLHV